MNTIQYTIRNIPPAVDRVLRRQAKNAGKSFNQTVVETLTKQTFGTNQVPSTDFDWLHGKLKLDENFDEAIAEQSRVDETLWGDKAA